MSNRVKQIMEYDLDVTGRTIFLFGSIDEDTAAHVTKSLSVLLESTPVHVKLSTEGGCFYSAMSIYDALRAYEGHVTIEATGQCMSSGMIIMQAADTRVAGTNSTLMIHDGTEYIGESRPSDVQAWAKHNKIMGQRMYKMFADRSGKTVRYWKSKCSSDYVMTADQAKKEGLIDEIT